MRNQIDTIPVTDAFQSGDECPFCNMERMAEQRAIRYVLGPGASYMEPDDRAAYGRQGFCRGHFKKLYDYENTLGNALTMQTYYDWLLEELEEATDGCEVKKEKNSIFKKKKETSDNGLLAWIRKKQSSCYLCSRLKDTMDRYYATFFVLIKNPEFRACVESSKGFCMEHYALLLEKAEDQLPAGQQQWFYDTTARLMKENLRRVKGDIDRLVKLFDYRNAGGDRTNTADAVSRGMQKLKGGYPADRIFRQDGR